MSHRDIVELREMSDEHLELALNETRENFFRLKIQAQTERLDAPTELQRSRKHIARIKTIQNERQRAGAGEAASEASAESK